MNPFAPNLFSGQRVLITGAGGGIGSKSAEYFAAAGAELVLVDLAPELVETVAAKLPEGTSVSQLAGDLTDADTLEELRRRVESAGGIDHLVLAAGIYTEHPVAEMSDEDWDRTMTINLDSSFKLTRALLPQMREGGSIVNFGSMAGSRGSRNHAHYAATKGAIVSFGRSLTWELGERNIRVNAVAPGIIATRMTEGLVASGGDALLAATPLHRFGRPEEVASAVVFLCSPAASFINGDTLHVNGGLHMAG
ncbi:3-oxoacyl-[acyl-carrier protein] reductase [Brevibacterium siliguriense]|uniref:3-oxoacyl-[acyl-carrier protein] reductase n=1 Tax=Brevibacterium siliguriense TaxID=1136497 RepID=A0A1H1LSK9_9MICO|nr:SDR family NAD(P)-dependent oxidoreductase [Brevibacterium siliguriense]SDR77511.1 3-oxoacyl-[acyl-carrier protein] reductase [Brevibacterium siliguriense]